MRRPIIHPLWSCAIIAALALVALDSASAESKSSTAKEPTFGSRTENSDGSVEVTIGRRLPTEWETKFGTDVQIAAPIGRSPSENLLLGTSTTRSSGAVWGKMSMPGLAPYVWDKTLIEARIDSAEQESKLAAKLSRTIPIGQNLSVTLENSYSIKHALPEYAPEQPTLPMMASPLPENTTTPEASWAESQLIRLDINSLGTALSAGGGTSSTDEQWHNKLSIEQKLFGPLKITTSVEDAGTAASKKSITAKLKHTW